MPPVHRARATDSARRGLFVQRTRSGQCTDSTGPNLRCALVRAVRARAGASNAHGRYRAFAPGEHDRSLEYGLLMAYRLKRLELATTVGYGTRSAAFSEASDRRTRVQRHAAARPLRLLRKSPSLGRAACIPRWPCWAPCAYPPRKPKDWPRAVSGLTNLRWASASSARSRVFFRVGRLCGARRPLAGYDTRHHPPPRPARER